ncbi:Crp/Fnr family transcriptional regulator [Blautia schinkii]|nr:Crp/Fnr family transcriptional regulator [Blautia schinkii]
MDLRQLIQKAPDTVGSSIMNRRYPKGSHILYPEEKNTYLFLLLEGMAEVYEYTANGMFISLYRYHKNNCFGEIELFCSDRTTLGITACEDCEVAVIKKETVILWASSDRDFCQFLLEQMASKIADNSDAYIRSSSMTLRQRVLHCLYRHHESGTLNTLNKEKLANEVCAPLRSLNRVISQCKEEGLIDYHKHQFYITNIGMLEEIICS